MKKILKLSFTFVVAIMMLMTFTKVNATDGESIGTAEARIKGTNYVIETNSKRIRLSSNANVELSGNAEDYFVEVNENATNVIITLNNYRTVTGGWINAIKLNNGSSAKVVLVGNNRLESGSEASAIRVPEGSSLVIEGTGSLTAKISNGGASASSAVIGSQYDLSCGDITINGGTIETLYSGGGTPSGIGTGDWYFNENAIEGNIIINGGNVTTEVLGSAKGGSVITVGGNGNAIIHTEILEGSVGDFNGVIFVDSFNVGEARGNATITENLTIPSNYSFTVAPGATLNISENVTLTNNGVMNVLGAVMNNGNIENTGTFTNNGYVNSNTEIQGATGNTVNPASYEYLAGANLNYIKGENENAIFRINANYNLFTNGGSVYVNDRLLGENDYTSESGSTIISLTKQYMSALTPGNYTLKVVFNNRAVSKTTFSVAEPTTNDTSNLDNPKTYDNIITYFTIFGLSTIGLAGIYIIKKKIA